MKKFFLFVATMLTVMSVSVVYAKDILIEMKKEGHTSGPRSEVPVITASIDNRICRTNVSEYSGSIAVTVENAAGDTLLSLSETVFDSTQFVTDVSNLDEGSYTITYTLEDSTVLSGEFENE